MKIPRLLATVCLGSLMALQLAGCSGKRGGTGPQPVSPKPNTIPEHEKPLGKITDRKTADLIEQARIALDRRDFAAAARYTKLALAKDPKSARARLYMGKIEQGNGRFAEAVKHLETAQKQEPENTTIKRTLGEVFDAWAQQAAEADDPQTAIDRWQRCVELKYKNTLVNRSIADAYRRLSEKLGKENKFTDAETALQEAIARMPENPVLRLNLGRLYLDADRLTEAQRTLKALVESTPSFVDGRVALAEARQRAGDVRGALSEVKEVLARVPDHPQALMLQGALEQHAPQVAGADATVPGENAEGDGPDANTSRRLNELEAAGDMMGQINLLKPLADRQPPAVWAQLQLARVLEKVGRADAATPWIRRYLEARPDDHRARFFLARCLQLSNNLDEALNLLESLKQDGQANLQIYDELGQIYAKKGRFDEARQSWEAALTMDPQYPGALFNFAQLAMEQGKAQEAKDLFNRALAADPYNLKVHYFAGLNLKQSGDIEGARLIWESTRSFLNPQDPYGARIKAALGEPVAAPVTTALALPGAGANSTALAVAPPIVGPTTGTETGGSVAVDVQGGTSSGANTGVNIAETPGIPGVTVDDTATMTGTNTSAGAAVDASLPGSTKPAAGSADPVKADPGYQTALQAARAGQYPEALAGFEEVLQRFPGNANVLINLGNVHLAQQRLPEAAVKFQAVLERDPNHAYTLGSLAKVYQQLGLNGPAADLIQRQAEARGDDATTVLQAATQLAELGRREAAQNLIENLGSAANKNPAALAAAQAKIKESGNAAPKANPRSFVPLVTSMLTAGQTALALPIAKLGAAENPDKPELVALYGDALLKNGDAKAAEEAFKKTIAIEKTNPLGYVKLGDLYANTGRADLAMTQYQFAMQARDIDPGTMLDLAERFRSQGDNAAATQILERVRGMNLSPQHAARLATLMGGGVKTGGQ